MAARHRRHGRGRAVQQLVLPGVRVVSSPRARGLTRSAPTQALPPAARPPGAGSRRSVAGDRARSIVAACFPYIGVAECVGRASGAVCSPDPPAAAEAHVASPSPAHPGEFSTLAGQTLSVGEGQVSVADEGVSRQVGVQGNLTVYTAGPWRPHARSAAFIQEFSALSPSDPPPAVADGGSFRVLNVEEPLVGESRVRGPCRALSGAMGVGERTS